MTTVLAPPGPVSTLEDAISFLEDVRNDVAQTSTETDFEIQLLGKSYIVRKPTVQEHPRRTWRVYVDDGGLWPDRSDANLGYQWEWEYAIDTVISDVTRFFPFPDLIDLGLYLWFDISDESCVILAHGTTDEVEQLLDKSENSFDTEVQDVSADRPRLVDADLNSLDVVSFDGIGQHLILPINSFKDWTLFVVGRFQSSSVSDRGTFVSAMGLEDTFGGMDAYVLQNSSFGTEGTLQTYIDGHGFLSTSSVVSADTYAVMEWIQEARPAAESEISINGSSEDLVIRQDLLGDNFDTTRQPHTGTTPVKGAIGRTNAGTNPGFEYNYLEGSIAEVVLYNRRLSDSERLAVRTGLQTKWQL